VVEVGLVGVSTSRGQACTVFSSY